MKRTIVVAALLLALLVPGTALAAERDVKGPPCADLGTATGQYVTDTASGLAVFTIELSTHDPSCSNVRYILREFSGLFADQVQLGTGTSSFIYVVDLGPTGSAPTEVCVYFTSELGNHVTDRSPDATVKDCVPFPLDPEGGPGGEGFDQ